jgi:hypothetical protein
VDPPDSTLSWSFIAPKAGLEDVVNGTPVGESVVKGLWSDDVGTNPGGIIRGNGYDGVLAVNPGVAAPRMVLPDSVDSPDAVEVKVEVVAGPEDPGVGDVLDSSCMGEMRVVPGPS